MTSLNKNRSAIQGMFSEIAGTYDRANSIISLGLHVVWKRNLISKAAKACDSGIALDLCCGTGDILNGLQAKGVKAVGIDFALPMLRVNRNKGSASQADALRLPFRDHTFSVATVSYGVRNFESLQAGLAEIFRVLKPGGSLFVLEFGQAPKGFFGKAIRFYEQKVVPALGGLISGKKAAYQYLATSSDQFPGGIEFLEICKAAGFSDGKFESLTFGATFLYQVKK